jgi:hypothetical protein
MNADQSRPRKAPTIDLSHLPKILSVTTERRRYDVPRLFVEDGKEVRLQDVLEVIVETDGPFVKRALSPVLFVGGVPLTESRRIDDHHYAFYGPRSHRVLVEGGPISLSWTREGPLQPTEHRLEAQPDKS